MYCLQWKQINTFPSLITQRSLNDLLVYQINFYQHLAFMNKLNKNKVPLTFNKIIKNPFYKYKYATKFSNNCFSPKAISLKSTKYYISTRGPGIWKEFLTKEEKELQSFPLYKKVFRTKLLEGEHELEYFLIKQSHLPLIYH